MWECAEGKITIRICLLVTHCACRRRGVGGVNSFSQRQAQGGIQAAAAGRKAAVLHFLSPVATEEMHPLVEMASSVRPTCIPHLQM